MSSISVEARYFPQFSRSIARRIFLHQSVREQVTAHLLSAYPGEGCGFLLGRDTLDRVVTHWLPVSNHSTSKQQEYIIAPSQYLQAEAYATSEGLDLLGIFHSHPDHPALPSAYDLEAAWPGFSYLILSVRLGKPHECTSWVLNEDTGIFDQEFIHFVHTQTTSSWQKSSFQRPCENSPTISRA